MKLTKEKCTAGFIILILGCLFQWNFITKFPSYTHAWSQADHYALALGFVNNHLNFFKPETYILNRQFPNDWKVPSDVGTTAVDFPIHDYIPALLMAISGSTAPWIFRLYILLYSFVGLYFLFLLARLVTGDLHKSVLVLLFAGTSPLFVYYQGGFLPSIPSLANAIIGIYFYIKYLTSQSNRHFNLMLLFLTLATLSRSTFAIHFMAVLCVEFLRIVYGIARLKPKIIPGLLAVFAILGYTYYNHLLRQQYGSLFLNHLLPAGSFYEAWQYIGTAVHNWWYRYFSVFHYVALLGMIVLAVRTRKKPAKRSFAQTLREAGSEKVLLLLTGFLFAGCFLFFVFMIQQYPAHDYYFLDTFWLPVVLLALGLTALIPSGKKDRWIAYLPKIVFVFVIAFMVNGIFAQKDRQSTFAGDRTAATIANFEGADKFLDSLHVSRDAKMLVLDVNTPNVPFIRMGRKGYALLWVNETTVAEALKWNPDYIVFLNEFFLNSIYPSYPGILSKLNRFADNGRIIVCKVKTDSAKQTLPEFLGIEGKVPVYKDLVTFDSIADRHWENIDSISPVHFSGTKSYVLTKQKEFGITYKTQELPALTSKCTYLKFTGRFLGDSLTNCQVVVALKENGKLISYNSYDLQQYVKQEETWQQAQIIYWLPKIKDKDYQLSLYLWNAGKRNLRVDDFGFEIF